MHVYLPHHVSYWPSCPCIFFRQGTGTGTGTESGSVFFRAIGESGLGSKFPRLQNSFCEDPLLRYNH
jgi:hypothetical protein